MYAETTAHSLSQSIDQSIQPEKSLHNTRALLSCTPDPDCRFVRGACVTWRREPVRHVRAHSRLTSSRGQHSAAPPSLSPCRLQAPLPRGNRLPGSPTDTLPHSHCWACGLGSAPRRSLERERAASPLQAGLSGVGRGEASAKPPPWRHTMHTRVPSSLPCRPNARAGHFLPGLARLPSLASPSADQERGEIFRRSAAASALARSGTGGGKNYVFVSFFKSFSEN